MEYWHIMAPVRVVMLGSNPVSSPIIGTKRRAIPGGEMVSLAEKCGSCAWPQELLHDSCAPAFHS